MQQLSVSCETPHFAEPVMLTSFDLTWAGVTLLYSVVEQSNENVRKALHNATSMQYPAHCKQI